MSILIKLFVVTFTCVATIGVAIATHSAWLITAFVLDEDWEGGEK